MKLPSLLAFLFLFPLFTALSQNVGFNDDNSEPKPSAMLDVFSATKGLLIPRVTLTSTTSASPVSSPETSLLIYNTASTGDVTPGYYYWNSTRWVRLVASADPAIQYNLVTKTADATLQKTENTVIASGDIMLTLPAVTSADNGLEISVKCEGTYMDIITIQGATEAVLLDGYITSNLYNHWGRTFIAYNGNWVSKENLGRPDNIFDVSEKSSWTTIAEAVEFLGAHMQGPSIIRLGGGEYYIDETQVINLPFPLTIEGGSYGESTITGTAGVSGTTMFDCQTECYFKMLIFQAFSNGAGNDAIHLSGSGEYYEIKDSEFDGFNKCIVQSTDNEIWFFECTIADCLGAGLEIAAGSGSGGTSNISETDFLQCTKGISMLSGAAWTIGISNCNFYNTPLGSDIGIYYYPASFTNFSSIIISNNGYNNEGTFISGFDFSRTDGRDANAFIDVNHGMESKKPHFNINVLNNNSTTTITNSNSWYKCSWTNTSTYNSSWLIVNNKCTYLPVNNQDVVMWISGSISVNNTNRTLSVGIVKNGVSSTRYGEMKFRSASTSNQPVQFSTVVYLSDVSPGDYFELYVNSTTSGDIVKVMDLAWFSNSQ
jgi:hypothetical protein